MDKITQMDVWDLSSKLSKGLIPLDSPAVTQTKKRISERFPELEEKKEWERILYSIRNYPGIESNSLCEKADVLLAVLIHMEEEDNEQLLIKVTRRGGARFYYIGDWGVFWLVFKEQEVNQKKNGEKVSTDANINDKKVEGDEGLINDLEKRIMNTERELILQNLTGRLNEIVKMNPSIEKYLIDENNGFIKEIKPNRFKDKDKEDNNFKYDSFYYEPNRQEFKISGIIASVIRLLHSESNHNNKQGLLVRHSKYNLTKDINIGIPTSGT